MKHLLPIQQTSYLNPQKKKALLHALISHTLVHIQRITNFFNDKRKDVRELHPEQVPCAIRLEAS